MAITDKLPVQLKDKLVDALLECEQIGKMPENRQRLIDRLKTEIRNRINYAANPKDALAEIVDACSQIPDGIYELYRAVGHFEQNSFGYLKFCIIFAEVEILFQYPACGPALPSLRRILNALNLSADEAVKLYTASAREMPQVQKAPAESLYLSFLQIASWIPAYGIRFLERVFRHTRVQNQSGLQELRDWIDQSSSLFGLKEMHLDEMRDAIEQESRSLVYVLVKIVENQLLEDTFFVEAWSWRNGKSLVPLEIQPPAAADEHHKFPDLETLMRNAINKVEEDFDADGFVVEIITQRKVFAKDISAWKVDVGTGKGDLLSHYPVIFRWEDRFVRPKKHRLWKVKWQTLKALSAKPGIDDLCWLECDTACSPEAIINGWVDSKKGLCLALGYSPSERSAENDLIEAALNVGTPIILWVHRPQEDEQLSPDYFKAYLNSSKLVELPKHVWDLRKEAFNDPDHFARRLTLIFDDADRVLR